MMTISGFPRVMLRPILLLAIGAGAAAAPEGPKSLLIDDRASTAQGADGAGPFLELRAGEKTFRAAGRPVFVLGRNPAARGPDGFADLFDRAAAAGETFMRIHFTHTPPGEAPGDIAPAMLAAWDRTLDAAEQRGLAVLPTLGIWGQWNDGSRGEDWHNWDRNPFNAALGGPAAKPAELFDDSECRRLWLRRLETLVRRWKDRRCIVAWEIFSELDLVTGATEERGAEFGRLAAAVIRAADPWRRPVTASLSGMRDWPKLFDTLDFLQVHPYAGGKHGGNLDELILSTVRARLAKFGKPVMIGECGLSAAPPHGTLDVDPEASVGIRHAIWAAVVSGAMNGRMLWWQDGRDVFENADISRFYHDTAAPAATFVRDIDWTDFAPVACDLSGGIKGAAIGADREMIGWFRDAACVPPDWPQRPVEGQWASIEAPGGEWRAEFVDPVSGAPLSHASGETRIAARDGRLRVDLPTFTGSLAVRLRRLDRP